MLNRQNGDGHNVDTQKVDEQNVDDHMHANH